ncbi:MAG: ABC-2 transporter permease [Bacilli bacterium]|nr:ABC-2 transporter permease [Bacilli bacterium]
MKALIYKELKLAMHPICYVFIVLFPFMILIPSYPLGIGFIYVLTCYPILFLGANKGQQSNDLLYSTLLPVRKKDIVMARILTVIFMQIAFILVMTALYPVARIINNAIAQSAEKPSEYMIPGLGLDSYVLLLAIALVGYAIADIIFFPIYYKHGKSIVMSTLFTILGFVVYIGVFTIGLPFIPGLDILNNLHLGIQFAILIAAILISFALHIIVYKVSAKRLEKVDF